MKGALKLITLGMLLGTQPLAAQSKTFEQTVQLNPGGSLSLHATKGTVRLTAWDSDQVEIRARIEADTSVSAEYARQSVDSTRVDVFASPNLVTIHSNYSNVPYMNWMFGESRTVPAIHYEIRAPKRLNVRMEIDRSDTILTGFEGRMELDIDRSEIEATDLAGSVRAVIDRGGASSFRNIRGSVNVQADRTNLQIDFASLEAASSIEIDRGDVEVSVLRGQGLDLRTNLSRRANFDTNLPLQTRGLSRQDPSGSVNGGGPRLAIEADRSRVRLRG